VLGWWARKSLSQQDKRAEIPREGDVLAQKYVVERVLGAGGMGIVVAARHKTLGQRVAMKFLLPEVTKGTEAEERFLREARAAVGLRSEHIARVLDVGTLDSGAPYIVMEHLDGSDLKRVLEARGPLPVPVVAEYVLQACEAIAEAHSLGIVHRDLKPANLFVTTRPDGSPLIKVLDFGISKSVSLAGTSEDASTLTRTDAILGSPTYMSPEQLRSPKEVDHRTDIWALGVLLYELLSDTLPFDGDNLTALTVKIVMEAPAPLAARVSPLSPVLEAVVRKCLEKDPAARFANVGELAQALAPFAPAEARISADRVVRLLRASASFDDALRVDAATLASSNRVGSATAGGWGQTQQPARSRSFWMMTAGLVVAISAAAFSVFLGMRSGDKESAEPAASAGSAEPSVRPSPPRTAPTSEPASMTSVARATPDVPVASASADKAVETAAPARKPRTVASGRCRPREVLSKGHCCPVGLTWQGTRCDRPLATDVPF
jgi:serine/threonine protein kinase